MPDDSRIEQRLQVRMRQVDDPGKPAGLCRARPALRKQEQRQRQSVSDNERLNLHRFFTDTSNWLHGPFGKRWASAAIGSSDFRGEYSELSPAGNHPLKVPTDMTGRV